MSDIEICIMKYYKKYSKNYTPNIEIKTEINNSLFKSTKASKNDSKKYYKWNNCVFDFICSIIFSIRNNLFWFFDNPVNASKKYNKKWNYECKAIKFLIKYQVIKIDNRKNHILMISDKSNTESINKGFICFFNFFFELRVSFYLRKIFFWILFYKVLSFTKLRSILGIFYNIFPNWFIKIIWRIRTKVR